MCSFVTLNKNLSHNIHSHLHSVYEHVLGFIQKKHILFRIPIKFEVKAFFSHLAAVPSCLLMCVRLILSLKFVRSTHSEQ